MRIVSASADWALGLLDLGLGRPADALQHLLALTGPGGHPGILLWAAPDLVEAAVRAGRPDACSPVLERFEAWATGSRLPVPAAALARCNGLLAARCRSEPIRGGTAARSLRAATFRARP